MGLILGILKLYFFKIFCNCGEILFLNIIKISKGLIWGLWFLYYLLIVFLKLGLDCWNLFLYLIEYGINFFVSFIGFGFVFLFVYFLGNFCLK